MEINTTLCLHIEHFDKCELFEEKESVFLRRHLVLRHFDGNMCSARLYGEHRMEYAMAKKNRTNVNRICSDFCFVFGFECLVNK